MIELTKQGLRFSFLNVHAGAVLDVEFQRTLRIPDDDQTYPLPPGLGTFPLRHVDDFAARVPPAWMDRGGVMLPMYQSEAMWLNFSPHYVDGHGESYPFAIKIAAGKINAVTGESWTNGLARPQDYMVAPGQPWLDGFCVEKGVIRQFVAMPLGAGYSAEEQTTGRAEHGGLQIIVYPMKRDVFERRFPRIEEVPRARRRMLADARLDEMEMGCELSACAPMALAPGGRMRQEIFDDPFGIDDWDTTAGSRCFVHLVNSMVWRDITGHNQPTTPPTAREYTRAGLPWFDYYDDKLAPMKGSPMLEKLKSVATLGKNKGDVPLPDNEPVSPTNVVTLRKNLKPGQVREGSF